MFEATTTTTRLAAEAHRAELARQAAVARRGGSEALERPGIVALIVALIAVVLPA